MAGSVARAEGGDQLTAGLARQAKGLPFIQ